MTQSAPTKLPVGRTMHETVQVAHHDRESLHLRKLGNHIPNFIGRDSKHTFARSTIIADICHPPHCGQTTCPYKAMDCPAAPTSFAGARESDWREPPASFMPRKLDTPGQMPIW